MLLSVDSLRTRHLPDVSADDAAAEGVLEGLLAAVEQIAARWLGYPTAPTELGGRAVPATLEERDYVLFPRSRDRGACLVLPVVPVTDIVSVTLSETADWPDDGTDPADARTVATTDYRQEDALSGTLLWRRASASQAIWPGARNAVRVVCTAGYALEADLPLGVADALYRAAADVYQARRVRLTSSTSQGGVSQSFRELAELPPDARQVLAPYRLWGVVGFA